MVFWLKSRQIASWILVPLLVAAWSLGMRARTPVEAGQNAASQKQPDHPEFPPGDGREAVMRLCVKCHSPNIILASGQDRKGWENTITKMVHLGATGTDEDFTDIADYLTANFPVSSVKKIFVNSATDKQIAEVLEISIDDAKALIAYREKIKGFKSLEDMKQAPGVDVKKIDAKKDCLVFGNAAPPPST
jgi:competence protein ComEA